MPTIRDTAYPRFKNSITKYELEKLFTPNNDEIKFANKIAKKFPGKPCLLILLKSFQNLGYFPNMDEIPPAVIKNVSDILGDQAISKAFLKDYDLSGTRSRHMAEILKYLGIKAYQKTGKAIVELAIVAALDSKDDLVDLINISLEELVKNKIEMPGFHHLLKTAQSLRAKWNITFFKKISNALTPLQKTQINALFTVENKGQRSKWDILKEDTGNPTLTHLKELLYKLKQLKELTSTLKIAEDFPLCKIERFGAEARATDAYDMMRFNEGKRYALSVCLLYLMKAQVLDDLGEMIIKKMRSLHNEAEEYLQQWRIKHQTKTDELISKLGNIAEIFTEGSNNKKTLSKIGKTLGKNPSAVAKECRDYNFFISNNYFSFIFPKFSSHRKTFFDILDELDLISTSSDQRVLSAIKFIKEHRNSNDKKICTYKIIREKIEKILDLKWIPGKWWTTLTGSSKRNKLVEYVDKNNFEVCVFSQMAQELRTGDLAIVGSKEFSDCRDGLISKDEVPTQIKKYSEIVGIPLDDPRKFISHLKELLDKTATKVNLNMATNKWVIVKNGELSILRGSKKETSKWINNIERTIVDKLPSTGILDVLIDTDKWLHWTKSFKPISGQARRIKDATSRYLITTFCYGCNMGPNQTEKSLKSIDRKQIAWVDKNHISEAAIEKAITEIINHYIQYDLPKFWGDGHSVSADGTKWDLREHNLLSEYHIRYGGYGGIGYYHVADNYIALFSRFIPCGVWEAIYILDGLVKNESNVKPDTIHGDTQAQNATVFAFAYLLGIKLMPRIRNWKDLKFYKSSSSNKYTNLDKLFTDEPINWELIETHLPDMLQVILSIKAGKLAPSTILRKLGNKSKKNRLYFAFRELGRVIRTVFLLEYLNSKELRSQVQAATNKSESFNNFAQWIFFGGNSIIKNNDRDQQRKIIKYNHLVANLVIFHTVQSLTNVISELFGKDGAITYKEVLVKMNPYTHSQINRFGEYRLDLSRAVPPMKFTL
ncbi:MAG: Tn3 family transposase [Oligoflexia bacterium]|nr:Tn3 family transposase [Oligoflexia bacterium]